MNRIIRIILMSVGIICMICFTNIENADVYGATVNETADFTNHEQEGKVADADSVKHALNLLNKGSSREKASWRQSGNGYVLTLNNVSFETSNFHGVLVPDNTTIVVRGNNTIKSAIGNDDAGASSIGIYGTGKLSFEGDGILNVIACDSYADYGCSCGITGENIYIKDATINASGGVEGYTYAGNTGIYSKGEIVIDSGNVAAVAKSSYKKGSSGITAVDLIINGGIVKASGPDYAFYCDNGIKVASDKIIVGSAECVNNYDALKESVYIGKHTVNIEPMAPYDIYTALIKNTGESNSVAKTVKVYSEPIKVKSVSLNTTELSFTELYTAKKLVATILPQDADNKSVTWQSDNTDIATVDQNGNVTAKGNGITTITVTTDDGNIKATCKVTVDDKDANTDTYSESVNRLFGKNEQLRIAGAGRYETAMLAADGLKQSLGVSKFENVIVACGDNYPDALTGSYLAKVKKAPIFLVNRSRDKEFEVKEYVTKYLQPGGTVYILGGEGAVTEHFEKSLSSFTVKRLAGDNRYDTNIAILKEAGVSNEDLLICTGSGFADSLSASAAGKPILLADSSGITGNQTKYLRSLNKGNIYLIGGEGAVSNKIGTQLKSYDKDGKVERVSGVNRYKTSTAVAKKFFPGKCEAAVFAYAHNFPDGLSGGPLAMSIGSPLILTDNAGYAEAKSYSQAAGISKAIVLGGESLISDKTVNDIIK